MFLADSQTLGLKKVIYLGTNVKPQLPKAYERIISNEVCPSSKVTSHFGCKAQTRIFLGLLEENVG